MRQGKNLTNARECRETDAILFHSRQNSEGKEATCVEPQCCKGIQGFEHAADAAIAEKDSFIRECRHKIDPHSQIQRICTMAKKEDAFLAYRVAMPRQRFRCRNAFSTRWRIRYKYRSYSRGVRRLVFGGMIGAMSRRSASWTIASVS